MNLSIIQAFKSKTVWAAVGMIAFNGVQALAQNPDSAVAALHLTGDQATLVNWALAGVAIWGRMHPKQGVPPTAK